MPSSLEDIGRFCSRRGGVGLVAPFAAQAQLCPGLSQDSSQAGPFLSQAFKIRVVQPVSLIL